MTQDHVEYFDGAIVRTDRGALVVRMCDDDEQQAEIVGEILSPTAEHVAEVESVLTQRNIQVVASKR
jgi:hypothetical protein